MHLTLHDVEEAIQQFPPNEQQRLLSELPRLLKISAANLALLKLAEPSFQFWENSDDAIYDRL